MRTLIFDSVVVMPTAIATIEWGTSKEYKVARKDWQNKQEEADEYERQVNYLLGIGERVSESTMKEAVERVRAMPEPDPSDYRVVVVELVNGRKFYVKDTAPLKLEQEVLTALR